MKKFDIVVFGGSGYTGEHVIRELFLTATARELSWAIAGRSLMKLRQTLQKIAIELHITDYSDVGVIVADVNNAESIHDMCRSAKLLINCVGPYFLWGRVVVEGCINAKCHYLDISGEPLFMEQTEADFHFQAEEAEIVIVSACGFDSIPADVGVRYAQLHFPGTLTSIESYLKIGIGEKGFSVHFPTFQCIVNGFSNRESLIKFRKDRKLPKVNKFGPHLRIKTGIWKEDGLFCVPFAGSDRSVICRTQRTLSSTFNIAPAQTGVYLMFQNTCQFLYICLFGLIFACFINFKFGRKMLLKHPRLLTLGLVSRDGATPDQIAQSSFCFTHKGIGFGSGRALEGDPDQMIEVEVQGPDPGYVSCSRFITHAAYSVLEKGPQLYGVLTPGAMLDIEDYVNRLSDRGITFTISKIGSCSKK